MLQVIGSSGEEIRIGDVHHLRPLIPEGTLKSLKQEVNDDDTFDYYLEKFIGQNRKTTVNALGNYVSTVVRILNWKGKDELPGDRGYADWVMFHYLTPHAQATGGRESAIWKKAKEAIGRAQHEYRFNGAKVLALYSAYTDFFVSHGIDAGDPGNLAELGYESGRGSEVDSGPRSSLESALEKLPAGKPFIIPFSYGGHQTYIRISYDQGSYRLQYFDRQRQPLTLKGIVIPGYLQDTVMTEAQPVYFDFEMKPGAIATMCQEAQSIAADSTAPGETLVNVPRQRVLEKFAGAAKGVAAFGALEPAQHPDAINCPWASLESIIRFFLGPAALQRQVEFIREVAVTLYIADEGDPAEKEAAGLATST